MFTNIARRERVQDGDRVDWHMDTGKKREERTQIAFVNGPFADDQKPVLHACMLASRQLA